MPSLVPAFVRSYQSITNLLVIPLHITSITHHDKHYLLPLYHPTVNVYVSGLGSFPFHSHQNITNLFVIPLQFTRITTIITTTIYVLPHYYHRVSVSVSGFRSLPFHSHENITNLIAVPLPFTRISIIITTTIYFLIIILLLMSPSLVLTLVRSY